MQRAASLALLIAPFASAPAAAQTFWPDHARFSLQPRINISVRPASPVPQQRPARIYAIELAPSPTGPADLRLTIQRRRQRFVPLRVARLAVSPGADVPPRTTIMMIDAQFDLPTAGLPLGDRLTAALGWHAAKISNRSVNATSLFSRDDLRARDTILPSAHVALAATDTLALTADYRETMQAYADSGTIGALGLDQPTFRAFRNALRPERDRRTSVRARWDATPGLQLGVDAFTGQVSDRLTFGAGQYLPGNLGSARVRGFGMEATHSLSPTLRWSLRYDQARMDMGKARRNEGRLALQGLWRSGPWRSALSVARTSLPAWAQPGHRLRVECGVDYMPRDARMMRLGLHLTDPDRLASVRLSGQPESGPVRAMDNRRALMASATLPW